MKRYRIKIVSEGYADVFHIRATGVIAALHHALARVYDYKIVTEITLSEVADIL